MENQCPVAQFVRQQIQVLGKSQVDIAREVGFEKPNVITMIKQGKTKLPLAKIGSMAKALETDPVFLLKLCLSTYHAETWAVLKPYFVSALTQDEINLLHTWRAHVGAPCVAASSDKPKLLLQQFLLSLQPTSALH